MNDVLNFLLVNDHPDERASIMRDLAGEFPECQFQHATSRQELLHAVESWPLHAVVTEHQLRWSDGITVLQSVKSRQPQCPVIMFTDGGSEEIAVRAMKAGCADYVPKSPGHPGLLPAALRMALARAAEREAGEREENRYHRFFEALPLGLFRIAHNGHILDANPGLVAVLRCPERDLLLATNLFGLFAESGRRAELQQTLEEQGVVRHFEAQLTACDGGVIWTETHLRAIRDGQEKSYEGGMQDITWRKEAEQHFSECREQLRTVAKSILLETDSPSEPRLPPKNGHATRNETRVAAGRRCLGSIDKRPTA